MSTSRALSDSVLVMEQARRKKMIGVCLLAGLLALITLSAVKLTPSILRGNLFTFSSGELLPIGGGLAWMALIYVCRYLNRLQLASALLIALALTILTSALYFSPTSYQNLLLPAVALPVALAALLMSFQAVYIVALLTGASTFLAWWVKLDMPLPLPLEMALPVISALAALTILALILAPLRNSQNITLRLAQQADKSLACNEDQLVRLESQWETVQEQQQVERLHIKAVLDSLGDGVIFTDADGCIVQTNQVAHQLWSEIIGGELDGRSASALVAELRSRNQGNDSKVKPIQHLELLQLGREPAQTAMGTTYVLLDRRERARLARLRGELLELLADEMRNPLTSMLTALEMTLGQSLPDGTDRVLVGARRSGQRLLELVSTLLDINQMEEARDVLRRSPIALRTVIESGVAQMAPLAQQGSVHVVVEYGSDAVLPLDKDRLHRAFVNLLSNALNQSPPYSTLQIQTQRQGSAIVVRVSDQGPGLPEKRDAPGLGLTFSKLVIEAHGGRLWPEINDGQGSTYAFSLPLEGGKG